VNKIDSHPILGQLNETQRKFTDIGEIQEAITQHSQVMERDGKITTVVAGVIGISGLFFLNPLPFYLVLGLLVIGLPLVWRYLVKEAREFKMSDEEIRSVLTDHVKE